MPALVGPGVRDARGADQGEADGGGRTAVLADRAGDVVAVGRVVDDGDAVAGLPDVHPAVAGDLETGRLPAGVGVGGPLDMAELDLGGRVRGADVHREAGLEELLRLVPVDVRLEVDPGAAGPERDRLGDLRAVAERTADSDRAEERVLLDDRDLRGVQQVRVAIPVVLVDVPGVPVVREVGVQAQEVALAGEDLAVRPQVVHRGQGAVVRDPYAHQAVVHAPPVDRHRLRGLGAAGQRRAAARRDLDVHRRTRAVADDLGAGVGAGVEGPGGAGAQRGDRLGGQRLQFLGDTRVFGLGLAVHPGDRGARQDVVELVEQDGLPEPVELLVRVPVAGRVQGGRRGPQLGLAQLVFAAPVALLGAGLGGVGGTVQLQVELADPDRRVLVLGAGLGEEGIRVLDLDPRGAFQVLQASGALHDLAGGAATSVAPAERGQRPGRGALLGVVADRAGHLLAAEAGVVGVDGRKVGEDAGAVDALPPESVVGELVGLVPGDLLGEEPFVAGQLGELRVGRVVAEGVGQPDALGLHAEVLDEEPLAVHELAGDGFAAGQVAVGLHPHAADRHPLALLDRLLDAGPHARVVVAHPFVLLGLRAGEDELLVLVRQRGHVGEGPGGLALGLADRPQPGRVDVRVAHAGDAVGARVRRLRQHRLQGLADGGRGAGDVVQVEQVHRVVEGVRDLVPARVVLAELQHQLAQHLKVQVEVPDLFVEDGDVGALEGVERLVAGREHVTERGRGGEVACEDVGVGGGLEQVVDDLAAGCRLGDRHVLVERVDRLQRGPVGEVDQGLGLVAGPVADEAEVDDGLDAATRELGGHLAVQPEPGGAPGRAPRGVHGERLVRGDRGFLEGHRLPGGLPGRHLEGDGGRMDRGLDALVVEALYALLDPAAFVVHGGLQKRAGSAC